jgi:hypothetical protein
MALGGQAFHTELLSLQPARDVVSFHQVRNDILT